LGPSFPGPIHEIGADISEYNLILSALPRYHPLRTILAAILGLQLLERYVLSNQKDDLDKSILYMTESLLSSPVLWFAYGPIIGAVLYHLAVSLHQRSITSKEPVGAIYAASYLRYLRDPAHAPFAIPRQSVTAFLVQTLAIQMELKASDAVQTLEEMAVLTHELLTSDPSSADTTRAITAFAGEPFADLPYSFPDQSQALNQMIKCLRLARVHKPEMQEVYFSLAKCLTIRYYHTTDDGLLDEAVSILNEAIASSSPGDFSSPIRKLVATQAALRWAVNVNGDPERFEEAIYRARAFLTSSSPEEDLYPIWSHVLENAANNRVNNFGPIGGLEPSSSHLPPWLPVPDELPPLFELIEGIRNYDITDVDEAIEKGRSILASSNPNDLDAPLLFGKIIFEAFERTKKIGYLNESIKTSRQLLARPLPKFLRLWATSQLFRSLTARSQISPGHYTQDVHGMLELFPQFFNDASGAISLLNRFHVACFWACLARATQHPSVPIAYETALSSMQEALLFAPTLQLQHTTLSTSPDVLRSMPLDYASYQLDLGQVEKAIETLERGRALLWSEMRHLRTSTDQLLEADPDLGGKFATVSRELEELSPVTTG
jgi:tetratricopeptide (TPR) repeat protein